MGHLSETCKKLTPAVCADDAVGVPSAPENQSPLHWYVAVVNNNSERKSAEILSRMGHDVYIPTRVEEQKRDNARVRKVERILLPAMVLIHCTEDTRRQLVNTPFIKRFRVDHTQATALGSHPLMVIPDYQIESFRKALDQAGDQPFEGIPFNLGEMVRVDGGQFDGLIGNVVRLPNGRRQLIIALGSLGGFKLSIAARFLKKIK